MVPNPRCEDHIDAPSPGPCRNCAAARGVHTAARAARERAIEHRRHQALVRGHDEARRTAYRPPPGFIRDTMRGPRQ